MIVKILRVLKLLIKWPRYKVRNNTFPLLNTDIGPRTFLRNTQIGMYSFIGRDCVINHSQIGNYTCIADGVQIGGMEHPYWDYSMSPKLSNEYVFGQMTDIGHDVWIAAGCIIKQGVTIGNGAVIGANSFVTKDVPPYAIVFGTPAKVYKFRFQTDVINKIVISKYWELPPQKAKLVLQKIKEESNE